MQSIPKRYGINPIVPTEGGFDNMIAQGTIKYAINASGDLLVAPKYMADGTEISHAVLTRGQPVISAGEADISGGAAGGYFGIDISPHSGHLMNGNTAAQNAVTVQAAKNAFARFGIKFLRMNNDCEILV